VLLVDVCATASLLVHVTVSPTEIVSDAGENEDPVMDTLLPGGGGGLELVDLSSLHPEIQRAARRAIIRNVTAFLVVLFICRSPFIISELMPYKRWQNEIGSCPNQA